MPPETTILCTKRMMRKCHEDKIVVALGSVSAELMGLILKGLYNFFQDEVNMYMPGCEVLQCW